MNQQGVDWLEMALQPQNGPKRPKKMAQNGQFSKILIMRMMWVL